MKTHSFTLVLDIDHYDSETPNVLYDAGFDDALFGRSNCEALLLVDREAPSSYEAVRSAILQVLTCGFEVRQVRVPPNWFGA
jgi:hypothetical protein